MVQAPCKNCELRAVGCRSACARWADYRKRFEEQKALISRERGKAYCVNRYRVYWARRRTKSRTEGQRGHFGTKPGPHGDWK